ncbi:MAG: hypothetical protein GYA48_01010 [Chloroflexi bacterium]|nr:hypothetical protein [Chloroflexota bacterium]
MSGSYQGVLSILKAVSEILTAGVAITAFSLLLYALSFNLRDRVARSFAIIMLCVVIVFTAEAIGMQAGTPEIISFWLKLQWVGIILLPAAYLQFSDALLATTGKPSRGRRRLMIIVVYSISLACLMTLPFNLLFGEINLTAQPAPFFQANALTDLFSLYYLGMMVISLWLLVRAYQRTKTPTSRRRIRYLMIGSAAPAIGSFPFLLFGSDIAARHPVIFWSVTIFIAALVGVLIILMAYAVAFFGVSWPDRVIKERLIKWIMRGPITASITLGLVTVTRRVGEAFGATYTGFVPVVMAASILLLEHLISIFGPFGAKWLFLDQDDREMNMLRALEDRLMTRSDLKQFLEMVLAAICDQLQSPGAYAAVFSGEEVDQFVSVGKTDVGEAAPRQLYQVLAENGNHKEWFQWGGDTLIPIVEDGDGSFHLIGLIGISRTGGQVLEPEQITSISRLMHRAELALKDRKAQEGYLQSLQLLRPEMDYLQAVRAVGRYSVEPDVLMENDSQVPADMSQWVKDALTHYWGGPKLTENPLLKLKIVKSALQEHDGNAANALRSILKTAIERLKPEGERRFTGEWILYNILELKFLEGKKVREVAMRLAMSEADLYRKQRVAVEEVAKAILEMEDEAYQDGLSVE